MLESEAVFSGVGDAEFVGEDASCLGGDGVDVFRHVADVAFTGVAFFYGVENPLAGERDAFGFDHEFAVDFLEDVLGDGVVDFWGDGGGRSWSFGGAAVGGDGVGAEPFSELGDGDFLILAAEADKPGDHAGVGDVGESGFHALEDPL